MTRFRWVAVVSAVAALGCSGGRVKPVPLPEDPSDMSVAHATDLARTCGAAEFAATQAPAAMLVVLDRSASMAENNKYAFAAQAIVQALDQDVFDSMWLGLYAAPSGNIQGPQCIFGTPVACQAPPFPQIDLDLAGPNKSGAGGVRKKIKSYLANSAPDNGAGDASPLYSAVQSALVAVQGWPQKGKRMLFIVTDGSISCAEFSKRPGFPDCNGCTHDWEDPKNIVQLLDAAQKDPNKPVDTFIVGVPGADTFDAQGCNYPPYHMRLALSAMAAAGSPANVPANCDGKTFTQAGGDPNVSCHVDLTQGNFNAQAIADTIQKVRGKVLGCTFELPQLDGGTVDPDEVNVSYGVGGAMPMTLKRRKDPMNQCVADGCWDYDMAGKVQLLGKACEDVRNATDAKVKIIVGCPTIIG